MFTLLKLSNLLAGAVTGIGKVAAWLALPLMAVIALDVVTRQLVNRFPGYTDTVFYLGATRLQELEWHLHAALFLLCLGFAYIANAHVRVELIRERLRPRTRAWIELIGCLLFLLPFCYIVLVYAVDFAERSYLIGEKSAAQTGLPHRWIIKSMLPLGLVILALAGASIAMRSFIYLFGPPELKKPSGTFVEVDEITELKQMIEEELQAPPQARADSIDGSVVERSERPDR